MPNRLHVDGILDFGAVAILVVKFVSPVVVTGIAQARAETADFAALDAKITAAALFTVPGRQILARELRHARVLDGHLR